MNGFNLIEQRLLNEYQHDFPLVKRPFLAIGDQLGIEEDEVIERLGQLSARGAVSRVGPVFSPGCIGASTLAALAVPPGKLDEMAHWINALPEVNHNYEREHNFNLWFVAAAPGQAWLDSVLKKIASESGCPMLVLPLVERFHIDLGFDLNGRSCPSRRSSGSSTRVQLDSAQTAIVAGLQSGIKLERQPFAAIGERVNLDEEDVIRQVSAWRGEGIIKRFGVVVRHHELGYRENAMAVWDVPDGQVSALGRLAAQQEGVTLCYRRPRQLPDWPFNLFCMVHGTDRDVVRRLIETLAANTGLDAFQTQVLFSRRRFKQCGARYVADGRN
ncbi:MAG TPA: Lrp/AsnC family transcriptional regulator [Methylophilaceae bacterium]|nr:Lrp/AsnC family transcriptional regulator [Methylophilaceae bacterium]HQR60939.1 Lrp/AsnC family transcriptional regulator [Methylophilaceae bacterium]